MINVLIVEDDITLNYLLVRTMSDSYNVHGCFSVQEALNYIKSNTVDLIISDIRLPDTTGISLLDSVKQLNKEIYIILMTGYGTVEEAVDAIKRGANDYILKPVEPELLKAKIDLFQENITLRTLSFGKISEMIFNSKIIQEVVEFAEKISKTDSTVIITGETGTGKGMLAKFIHENSKRRKKAFFQINCANFQDNLFESELFGHKKGAFTGAHQNKMGIVKSADGGTLFLDEITEIPMSFQAKLLRFIEDKKFLPIGTTNYEFADIRFISATNKDFSTLIANGMFREDLYYRLNVVSLHIPPLRERLEDIEPLLYYFIKKFKQINPSISGITDEALYALKCYNFPGNIRELSNIIERAMILEKGNLISVDSINVRCGDSKKNVLDIESIIKSHMLKILAISNGDKSKAAKILGIDRSTLYRKMKEFGITQDNNL